MGKQIIQKEKTRAVFVELPESLVQGIEEKAKEHHLSKVDVVRLILADFFKKGGKLVL